MLNDKKYTVQQKAAADPTNPAGGNTAIKGWRSGRSVGTREKINSAKLDITLIANINENDIQNTRSSISFPSQVTPVINIKIQSKQKLF